MSALISITVSHRGTAHTLSLLPETTFDTIYLHLEELTNVPTDRQKLLYKGKKTSPNDGAMTLAQAGIRDGTKMQLLGATAEEVGGLKAVEDEQRRRQSIMQERMKKGPTKVRSTGKSSSSSPSLQYCFHELVPLAHLPHPEGALALLKKLSNDPAIQHVMQEHQFAVGVLTELAPHEHPELLGLNVNKGQAVKLRLRTDRYDGFRLYQDVRRVLCHELTHNVWGDHDENFKALNSKLNREVVNYERAAKEEKHTLTGWGEGDMYQPASELEAEAHVHILGGNGVQLSGSGDESREERRRRILEATMGRLKKEEEELEQSCGTGRL